jgi:hypothetical protein
MSISKESKKKLCSGCRSERYNMGIGYQETSKDVPVTCKECWSLASARVVTKGVYYSAGQYRPYRLRTLSCWHNEFGYGEAIKK